MIARSAGLRNGPSSAAQGGHASDVIKLWRETVCRIGRCAHFRGAACGASAEFVMDRRRHRKQRELRFRAGAVPAEQTAREQYERLVAVHYRTIGYRLSAVSDFRVGRDAVRRW